ncbi:MAG: hypothetical protein ACPGTU_01185 [Myxococcota bacterium]
MLPLLLIFSVSAGDHKPLCDKVNEADLVMEISFIQKGHYPKKEHDNGWVPPESELLKTANTGVVTHVFKGNVDKGSPWKSSYGHYFDPGASTADAWTRFFSRQQFSQIYFLRTEAGRHTTTGWAEESADCGPSSDHRSWCDGYTAYKKRIISCLQQ